MSVASTEGNRNNELGVPLTVLDAGTETEALIVEMGMRGEGQIAELCRIARPTLGLVTNIGTSHMELLGSQAAIAEAKGELIEAIPADGAVFLNGDDPHTDALADRASAPVTRYGLNDCCDVSAADIILDDESKASFTLVSPQGSVPVSLAVPGRHNVYNALAAAAVALRLAVPLSDVAEGLGRATLTGMRMEVFTVASGVVVINDAYNANPTSMRAAIETLETMKAQGRRVAVLGDMGELGNLSEIAHLEIGEHVAAHGIDVLVVVGRRARRIGEGARAAGMSPEMVRPCATPEEAVEVLDDILEPGDVVLVKASRSMRLETVVEGLVDPRVG
jgi:UDP-N-acetylmuramoyl-tripeptide--D-alanyl-D-alanine ligase